MNYYQKSDIKDGIEPLSLEGVNKCSNKKGDSRVRIVMTKMFTMCIRLYQYVSPYLGIRDCCMFKQSCSSFAIRAIERYGPLGGVLYIALRLLACQNLIRVPWRRKVKEA